MRIRESFRTSLSQAKVKRNLASFWMWKHQRTLEDWKADNMDRSSGMNAST